MTNPYVLRPAIKDTTFTGIQFQVSVNNIPINLTGATIRMSLKQRPSDTIPVHTFTTEDGSMSIAADPTTGIFTLNPQIITVPAFEYCYDIRFNLSNGTDKIYVWGRWKIIQNITE